MRFLRRRHYMSPLILFIFITSFSSVLSRHRIRHHRDRFKRQQGEHLYLAGSYVYGGGEGTDLGPWSEWSSPSPCSRSCGGGVSTETRQCTPGYTCQGPTTRHFSCNTQDCPDIGDFRAQQCSEFDSVPFNGVLYQWIPYTKAPNPCELNCMPRGERFYYRYRDRVIDGTRCNEESTDVCIEGKCQPVGCDMMLGSPAREDKCRICGGDGSTCNTVRGRLDMQDLQVGYNDILLIPAGATNMLVAEVAPSNNYLAIRNTSGHYYLNGNWRIDFPRTMDFAGCRFHYDRNPQGFSAPDRISCLGPIDEPLFIVMLYQDHNVGVDYEYSLPTNIQPGYETETYAWTFDQFSPCSQTCGAGVQHRNVTCAGRKTLDPADESLCDANNKPTTTQKCAEIPCEAQWVPYPWGNCSVPCGEGGIQSREIACQQIISNGYPSLVDESECLKLHPKPDQQQTCNKGRICSKWHTGPWKPCDHLCGDGKEKRQVTCYRNESDKIEIVDDSECNAVDPKPESEKKCNLRPCEGVDWITSRWSGCDKCGLTNETRQVLCATASGVVYPDDLCDTEEKPGMVRQCNGTKGKCEYNWYASQWSECSAQCGQGVQTRTLFCGFIDPDGAVKQVGNDKCDSNKSYETIRNCTGEIEKCPGEWYSGPWTDCSKPCGGGERSKKVVCLKDMQVVDASQCNPDTIVFSKEECNTQPCSEDTILPTDVTKSVDETEMPATKEFTARTDEEPDDKEEYELVETDECDDGEWVTDGGEWDKAPAALKAATQPMGQDKLGLSTEATSSSWSKETELSMDDLMLSDVPSSPGESEGTQVTGSGDGEPTSIASSSERSVLTGETTLEGSGDTESSWSTFETDTPIESESASSFGSQPTTGDTETTIFGSESTREDSTDSSKSSVESSKETTEVSTEAFTEASVVSSSTASSDVTTGATEITISASDMNVSSKSESSVTTESSELGSTSSDLETEAFSSDSSSKASPSTVYTSESGTDASSDSNTQSSLDDSSETTTFADLSSETSISSDTSSEYSASPTSTTESDQSTDSIPTDTTETTENTESTEIESTQSSSSESTESSETSESSSTMESSASTEQTDVTESTNLSASSQSSESEETSPSEAISLSSVSTDVTATEEISADSTVTTDRGSTDVTTSASMSAETEEPEPFIGESDLGSERETTKKSVTEIATTSETSLSSDTEQYKSSEVTTAQSGVTDITTKSAMSSEETTTEQVSAASRASSEQTGITEITTKDTFTSEITTEDSGGSTVSLGVSTVVSTETPGSTELTSAMESTSAASTESLTTETSESAETTEFDIWSSTTEATGTITGTWETTPLIEIFKTKKPRMCKRKKQKSCKDTPHGCCWDKITPAEGPFDKGCPNPKTCNETKHGCCEDGVSPAFGTNFKGCPSTHCNETLFGCCPDNITVAGGNNNEGCSPPPPACTKSKYGCCKDNLTEAEGLNYKGCEKEEEQFSTTTTATSEFESCDSSTFGCCPDGFEAAEGEFYQGCNITNCTDSYFGCCPDDDTPAEGPNYQGCRMPCSDSQFGCCSDGVTPAHGPSGEGCCLASLHGCCPDNILSARGPNLEGCGCQYSPYRCCPDNVTAARGHNNEGCGCQYTEHGCCPDEYTPAAGPEYRGCLCHTFQFGCCPDGITVAKGPHQQGCGCRNTEFGCCSDDRTPARGPNFAGCGCDSSKNGCCLDGTTEATGDNFEGCPSIPENLQESCTFAKERGPCRNYTVKWFFDTDYGGCSRFWYGGCDGNDNRFKTKEECDAICVKPEGTDRCKLPKVPGPCEGYYPQWYYDTERKHCAQFIYGGCLGNNNRFESREECLSLCVRDESVDACEQDKEEGPCKGNYLRWYYNKGSKTCQEFIYGGCKANNNNFPTEEACKQQCTQPGRKKDHCSLPRAQGNCTGREPKWYYDIPEKQCLPFYYSGCNGNNNNFISREACESDCPKEIVKDLCQLAAEIGTCGNYSTRWYYDTREKGCRQFYYGGCEGNGNNFETQQQCEQRCDRKVAARITEAPHAPLPTEEPFTIDSCFLPSENGTCRTPELRYHYDSTDGVCKGFTYGGCGGNKNNFPSVDQCVQHCGNAQDLCKLPPIVGPCNAEHEQFYYDSTTDSCKNFTYGGCGGNYNRFPDQASCEQRCKKTKPSHQVPQTQAPPVPTPPSNVAMCYEQPDPGNCTDNLSVFFFDVEKNLCTPFTYTGCGGNGNRFTSEEQCERQCGSFRGQDVCNLSQDPGPCRGYFIKYYYEKSVGRCAQFAFGGCGGNGNRFSSNEECESICVTHEERRTNVTSTAVCELPADTGSCPDGYHKRWYFDNARGECIAFIFSGCGGNLNNFKTFQSCVDFCKDYLAVTQPPLGPQDHPCQAHFDECATLRCAYGIEAFVDDNQCNRCQCQNPCSKVECPLESQCAIDINRNKTSTEDPDFIAICREINKQGQCPTLEHHEEDDCEQECRNDADCPLHLKCCTTGCGTSCVEPISLVPAELVTQSLPAYTEPPIERGFSPPKINVETYEPEVRGLIGDHVTLNCAVTGNPTPRITWKKDDLLIDGTQAKYRIKLDQSLQIITLHKTDAGIYLCTADNSVGEPVTNQIKLDVVDGPPRPASVLEPEKHPNVVVSLNAPATLNCLAIGYPFPAVTWWKDDSLIPLKTNQFEVRKDYSLLIHSVKLSNLGIYTCQAYNGVGKAASWSVTVKAKGPYHSTNPKDQKYLRYIVNPPELPTTLAPTQAPPVVRPTLSPYLPPANNEISPNQEPPGARPDYIVPVKTNITTESQRYPTNADITLPCIVDGYPTPQVQWYKDGVPVASSTHIQISDDNILTIIKATKADSGMYQCEAANPYSKSSSSVSILVDGMYIHPNCKDNRFFANCDLIVKAKFCSHKYYAKFCCRSCTEAGLLPVDGSHLYSNEKHAALSNNLV